MKNPGGIQECDHNKNGQNEVDANRETDFIKTAARLLVSLFDNPVSKTVIHAQMLHVVFVSFFLFCFY